MKIERITVGQKGKKMTFDPAGFFTIFIDGKKKVIVVEHYSNVAKNGNRKVDTGRLEAVLEGTSAEALCAEITERGMVTRLDHAAYLGRELERAERCLRSGSDYEQDA